MGQVETYDYLIDRFPTPFSWHEAVIVRCLHCTYVTQGWKGAYPDGVWNDWFQHFQAVHGL